MCESKKTNLEKFTMLEAHKLKDWENVTAIFGAVSEKTALVSNDYPWSFKFRTEKRYWIETTKRGQRVVTQTKNPKTGRWCNPKKSTYSAIKILIIKSEGHQATMSLDMNDRKEWRESFIQNFKDELDEFQRDQLLKVQAYNKVMDKVTFTVKSNPSKKESKSIEDANKEILTKINRAVSYEYGTMKAKEAKA